MKRLTALSLLSVLAITGCACGAKQDTYTVDGFNGKTFRSYDEFKTYLINSGIISYKHTNNYWTINGVPTLKNAYDTEQEAINAYLNIFDPERYMAEQVIFDSNGIATTIKMHVDTTTVYETRTHGWTSDARAAYESWADTNLSGLYYILKANGFTAESKDLDFIISQFKKEIKHQDAVKISPVLETGVVQGDYITVNGTNYTWRNISSYATAESVTPLPNAFMEYDGIPYEYKVDHSYTNSTTGKPVALFDGASGTSWGVDDLIRTDGEVMRIFSRASTGGNQTFAGQTLRNVDYVDGIDYKWNKASKKLVITTDKYHKQDGKDLPADDKWADVNCADPIGTSQSVFACFSENDINRKSGRIYMARTQETYRWDDIQPTKTSPEIKYTNVDTHALGYLPTGRGTNRAGWYKRVKEIDLIIDKMDISDLYNHQLTEATLYYHSSNTLKLANKQLTTSFANSYQKIETNPAGFYSPTFNFNSKAEEGTDYFLWDGTKSYYPTTNALAGARQLTNDVNSAYVVENEYWWIGNANHVTYNTLASAQLAAEQIARTLSTKEWRVGTFLGAGDYYTSTTSYEDAFNNYMMLNALPSKVVENQYLTDPDKPYADLITYTVHNPTVVYKIPGYDKYFDSKIDAFKWYRANVTNPISYVLATDTYSAKGLTAATQEELAKKIWDAYSKKVQ